MYAQQHTASLHTSAAIPLWTQFKHQTLVATLTQTQRNPIVKANQKGRICHTPNNHWLIYLGLFILLRWVWVYVATYVWCLNCLITLWTWFCSCLPGIEKFFAYNFLVCNEECRPEWQVGVLPGLSFLQERKPCVVGGGSSTRSSNHSFLLRVCKCDGLKRTSSWQVGCWSSTTTKKRDSTRPPAFPPQIQC